jgi:hypothetical protein
MLVVMVGHTLLESPCVCNPDIPVSALLSEATVIDEKVGDTTDSSFSM